MGCCVTEIVDTVDARVLKGRFFLHFLDKVIKIEKNRVLFKFRPNILKNIKRHLLLILQSCHSSSC